MKLALTLAGAAALALAGSVFAADKQDKAQSKDPGFNVLDKNNDGYLTRTEAGKNPELAKQFKKADRNNDGKLSRMEYLTFMTKGDLRNLTGKNKKEDESAATGGSKPAK
jgi:Ca2+-binding EF-hand superfamily protein